MVLMASRTDSSQTLIKGMETVEYVSDDGKPSRKRELEKLIEAAASLFN